MYIVLYIHFTDDTTLRKEVSERMLKDRSSLPKKRKKELKELRRDDKVMIKGEPSQVYINDHELLTLHVKKDDGCDIVIPYEECSSLTVGDLSSTHLKRKADTEQPSNVPARKAGSKAKTKNSAVSLAEGSSASAKPLRPSQGNSATILGEIRTLINEFENRLTTKLDDFMDDIKDAVSPNNSLQPLPSTDFDLSQYICSPAKSPDETSVSMCSKDALVTINANDIQVTAHNSCTDFASPQPCLPAAQNRPFPLSSTQENLGVSAGSICKATSSFEQIPQLAPVFSTAAAALLPSNFTTALGTPSGPPPTCLNLGFGNLPQPTIDNFSPSYTLCAANTGLWTVCNTSPLASMSTSFTTPARPIPSTWDMGQRSQLQERAPTTSTLPVGPLPQMPFLPSQAESGLPQSTSGHGTSCSAGQLLAVCNK